MLRLSAGGIVGRAVNRISSSPSSCEPSYDVEPAAGGRRAIAVSDPECGPGAPAVRWELRRTKLVRQRARK